MPCWQLVMPLSTEPFLYLLWKTFCWDPLPIFQLSYFFPLVLICKYLWIELFDFSFFGVGFVNIFPVLSVAFLFCWWFPLLFRSHMFLYGSSSVFFGENRQWDRRPQWGCVVWREDGMKEHFEEQMLLEGRSWLFQATEPSGGLEPV